MDRIPHSPDELAIIDLLKGYTISEESLINRAVLRKRIPEERARKTLKHLLNTNVIKHIFSFRAQRTGKVFKNLCLTSEIKINKKEAQ